MTDSLSSLVLIDVSVDGGPIAVEAEQPFLCVDDLGVVHGNGISETLLVRGGHTRNTDRHEKRFALSALALDSPASDLKQWRAATEVALRGLRGRSIRGDVTLQWVYSRGRGPTGRPTGCVLTSSIEKVTENRLEPISVMLAECGFSLNLGSRISWAFIGAKTLLHVASMAASHCVKSEGFDDVIFTFTEGKFLEDPTSTIIVQRDDELPAPNPGEGVLPGMAQAVLFEMAASCGWEITPTILVSGDLFTADTVWLVSSVCVVVVAKSADSEPIRQPDTVTEKEFRDLCDEALAAQQNLTQQGTKSQCAK